MSRQLRTTGQSIRREADQRPREITRQAFLVDTYSGGATEIMVQFNDPRTGTRGAMIKARVRPGIVTLPYTTIVRGTPVSIVIRHGKAEVIGLITGRT